MSQKLKCVTIVRPDLGRSGYTAPMDAARDLIVDELDGTEVGDTLVLTVCEMTEDELNALPEFTGW